MKDEKEIERLLRWLLAETELEAPPPPSAAHLVEPTNKPLPSSRPMDRQDDKD